MVGDDLYNAVKSLYCSDFCACVALLVARLLQSRRSPPLNPPVVGLTEVKWPKVIVKLRI